MTRQFNLNNQAVVIIPEVDGGVYSPSQLKKIAALGEQDCLMIKATEDQRLALVVKADKVSSVTSELQTLGMNVRNYQDGLHQPVSCLGALCPDHEQDALGTAMDISGEQFDSHFESPIKIGINGCGKCCTPCHTLDISLVGEANGYRISVGGKNAQYPEFATLIADGVPTAETPKAVRVIIDTYRTEAHPGESMHDFIERVGPNTLIAALTPWSQDTGTIDFAETIAAAEQESPANFTSFQSQDIAAQSPEVVGSISDIFVNNHNTSAELDIPIGSDPSKGPEIRIREDDGSNINDSDHQSNFGTNEADLESRLVADMSELANRSEELESASERDKSAEALSSSNIALDAEVAPPADEEKLNRELIDIADRLKHLESDIRDESSPARQHDTARLGWDFDGFDVDRSGNPVIFWSNGIKTVIDSSNHKSGRINIGPRRIVFSSKNGFIEIEIDGIKMIMPSAA
jgi:dissimilatory sulfite reductase (desulfoviridin) alpha/beta subunit